MRLRKRLAGTVVLAAAVSLAAACSSGSSSSTAGGASAAGTATGSSASGQVTIGVDLTYNNTAFWAAYINYETQYAQQMHIKLLGPLLAASIGWQNIFRGMAVLLGRHLGLEIVDDHRVLVTDELHHFRRRRHHLLGRRAEAVSGE